MTCSLCGLEFASPSLPRHLAWHHQHGEWEPVVVPRLSKDLAECCNARRDYLGRLPLGYCSSECVRRPGGGSAA